MERVSNTDAIRRKINKMIRSGQIVVTENSRVWGPLSFETKDGKIKLRTEKSGVEGFGKEGALDRNHQVFVNGRKVWQSGMAT